MCLSPIKITKKFSTQYFPCGHCLECRIQYSSTWAYRIALESSLYEHNCFITLTYNEDYRPKDDHLSKRDLQLFIKKLRKHFKNDKIRYFACGEYGSKKGRPHYHIILFNVKFDDLYFWCLDNKKTKLYRSPTLERLWSENLGSTRKPIYKSMGFSSVADLTIESAKYCAKYLQKIPTDGRPVPFVLMSKRPGLGLDAFKESWLKTDKLYVQGKTIRIPRYFLDKAKNQDDVVKLKERRKKNDVISSYCFINERNEEVFYNELYVKYLDSRISKLEKIFRIDDILDTDGKKAIKKQLDAVKKKNKAKFEKNSKNDLTARLLCSRIDNDK